jgi:UDP-2,3-diacylglucosamine hydrolase
MSNEVLQGKELILPVGKRAIFISDVHLGVPNTELSLKRERVLCAYLRSVAPEAGVIFILGDLFDFWFEYSYAVPKGFTRILGTLADLTDKGVEIHFFRGNHDLWAREYLKNEAGLILHSNPEKWLINGKVFVIGHGDALGPGDHGYKFMKRVFLFPPFVTLFRWLHPDIGIWLARFWSGKSRAATSRELYLGDDNEWLVCFCRDYLKRIHVDYFVFGHRHLVLDIPIGSSRYLNLGEWFNGSRSLFFQGDELAWHEIPSIL